GAAVLERAGPARAGEPAERRERRVGGRARRGRRRGDRLGGSGGPGGGGGVVGGGEAGGRERDEGDEDRWGAHGESLDRFSRRSGQRGRRAARTPGAGRSPATASRGRW